LGLGARVLPRSDAPVHSWVMTGERWTSFQEFMIRHRAEGPVDGMELRGIEAAAPPPEALEAIAAARAIVIGPSNPVISIRPILDTPGMREALSASPAKVVAVSPVVGGAIVKGPTEAFMAWAGCELSATGVAGYYGDILDGMVSDERDAGGLPVAVMDTLMSDAEARERVARETLRFAEALAS
jgi:LPPG:FO 2-phospho-L-lactate transferase